VAAWRVYDERCVRFMWACLFSLRSSSCRIDLSDALPSGLVLRYTFDNDSGTNVIDERATATAASAQRVGRPESGGACGFNGSGSYIDCRRSAVHEQSVHMQRLFRTPTTLAYARISCPAEQ